MVNQENRDHLVDHFKSEFEDFQPAVDSKIWDNIEQELHPAKKRRVIWWKWGVAASIVLGLLYVGLDQISNTEEIAVEEKIKNVEESQVITEPSIADVDSESNSRVDNSDPEKEVVNVENPERIVVQEELSSSSSTAMKIKRLNLPNNEGNSKDIEQSSIASVDVIPNTASENMQNSATAIMFVPAQPQVLELGASQTQQSYSETIVELPDTDVVVTTAPESTDTFADAMGVLDTSAALSEKELTEILQKQSGEEAIDASPKQSSRSWVLAANLLSMTGGSEAMSGTEAMDNKTTVSMSSTTTTVNSFQLQSQGGGGVPTSSVAPKVYSDIRYLPPIVTSITANYQISKRWSVEMGLAYSLLLANRETNQVNGEKDVLNVRMNYLGIPLLVKFDIVSNRKLVFYSNIGGMVDRGLKGKDTYTTVQGGNVISESNQLYSIDGLNLSASLGLGLNYRVNRLLSYYLQPGITAQFLGDGYLFNVRNNKLLWPNATTGLRVHLNSGK
ncbi:MAG: PorT family protein [Flavobacteriales bacterium]|nr:PorT family protein [Flavobacteriales bacterium]